MLKGVTASLRNFGCILSEQNIIQALYFENLELSS